MKLWEAFKAVSEGKRVEYKGNGLTIGWADFEKTNWRPNGPLEGFEFRLKPEPPEVVKFAYASFGSRDEPVTELSNVDLALANLLRGRCWDIVATEIKEEK